MSSSRSRRCRRTLWRPGTFLRLPGGVHQSLGWDLARLVACGALTKKLVWGHCSMISIFDEDGGGDVDFQEFVGGLSAFSSKGNKEEKLRFAFKVYDIDRDGYISNGELFIVLKMMVGSNLKDMQLQQVRLSFLKKCELYSPKL